MAWGLLAIALAFSLLSIAAAQEIAPPIASEYGGASAPATSYSGGGGFYSQQLGAHLRVRYNTESYGQNEGNLNIGSMKLFDLGDASAFIDGQVTMNDVDGVGYNVGGGYRWLAAPMFPAIDREPARIMGLSMWADGTSTTDHNFFPQIGFAFEALGDTTDLRANLYVPLGDRRQEGDITNTGTLGFVGNSLSQLSLTEVDNALTVAEIEVARRLGNREAWAFLGGYQLSGDEFDTGGVKAGVRGYALPDLFVQFALTNDDLFDTNAVFSVGWFIGRTRTNHYSTGTLADRLREPVLRNDYVAIYRSMEVGGTSLTNATGDDLRIVHVDSNATGSSNAGTFENPYTTLDILDDAGRSQVGDVILVHGGSTYTDDSALLQDNQRLLGEGNNIVHQVATSEFGLLALPETAAGAGSGAVPTISQTGAGTSITLADANQVNNFTITGGTIGVDGTTAAGNPTVLNLDISNTTGDGITLASFDRPDPTDTDNDGATTEVAFNATVNNVNLNNIGGTGISLNAVTAADLTSPLVDLNEAINISNVTVTGGAGNGMSVTGTNVGGTLAINNYAYNGAASGTGGLLLQDGSGQANIANSSFTGGAAGGFGLQNNNSDGTTTVAATTTFSAVTGNAVDVVGGTPNMTVNSAITNAAGNAVNIDGVAGGTITANGNITNTGGRSIVVQNNTGGTVNLVGDVTDTAQGILVNQNTGGTANFLGTYDLDTGANTAVTATNNTGSTVIFNGLDIDTTSGSGFQALGGGTIGVTAGSTVTTTTGTGLDIQNVTIATSGAAFDSVTVNGAANGIVVNNTTGGQLRVGTASGAAASGGTMTTTGDAIVVTNATNVQINRVTVTNSGGNAVTATHSDTDAYNLRLNGLVITAATADGIEANANGSGRFDLEVDNSTINQNFVLDAGGTGVVALLVEDSTFTTGNNEIGFDIQMASYSSGEILVQRNNVTTLDNNAFRFNATNAAINTVNFQLADNVFTNTSAASPTAGIDAGGGTTLNSTIDSNAFNNNGGGPQFTMDSNGANTTIRLSLLQNTANGATGTYTLEENAGDFRVFDLIDTFGDLNNQGNVTSSNEFNFSDDPGPIPTPNP